jgi:hippurate hydrolase
MLSLSLVALVLAAPTSPDSSVAWAQAQSSSLLPKLKELYIDLHKTPELSGREEKTAAKLASRLKALGYQVTTKVGGHGIVGVLKNGAGPTVMLRTDLDGLPMEEKTGLPYASKATGIDPAGAKVPVMHGCGHDVHMTSWIGAATVLAAARDRWRGTVVMVGQPAEETSKGAEAMLAEGLFTRFPKPDHAIALHVAADLAAGRARFVPGYALANVDSVDLTVFGRGGHGAYPHKTVDPIVIASRIVLGLQTLVSRENDPLDPAVVTVGSIHGGTKHNIIPDEVRLQLTVRSYKPEVRKALREGIERIARLEAESARAPKPPEVKLGESTAATYNDPALTERLKSAVIRYMGETNVEQGSPVMGAEDFGAYGVIIPSTLIWLGIIDPARVAEASKSGESLPALHSPLLAPDPDRALPAGTLVLTAAALEILAK